MDNNYYLYILVFIIILIKWHLRKNYQKYSKSQLYRLCHNIYIITSYDIIIIISYDINIAFSFCESIVKIEYFLMIFITMLVYLLIFEYVITKCFIFQ